jgi:hypothetical protein
MSKFGFAITGFIVGAVIAVAVTVAVLGGRFTSELKMLDGKYESALQEKSRLSDELSAAKDSLKELEGENSSLKKQIEDAGMKIADLQEQLKMAESKPVAVKPAEKKPEPAQLTEEEKAKAAEKERIMKAIDRLQQISKIGEPLSNSAILDLGLDENQVANVNDVLKDEGKRMLERLREFAATLGDGKTVDDFKGMNGVEISAKIQQHFMDELMDLRKLPPEDQQAINTGKRHLIAYVPKDGNFYRIVKAFYEERMKTYDDLVVHMDEETMEKFKNTYLNNGDFIFPGPAGYGTGHINPEDFER